MSLRSKIILILTLVVALYTGFDNGMLRMLASRSFEEWEREQAEQSLALVEASIQDELRTLSLVARTWASWDAVARFVETGDGAWAEANLGPRALHQSELDLFMLCRANGPVAWGRVQDPESGAPLRLREFPSEALAPHHPVLLRKAGEEKSGSTGLMMTERGAMLVASAPIQGLASADDGACAQVVLGRFLDDALKASIAERSTVTFDLVPLEREGLTAREQELFDEITSAPTMTADVEDRDTLRVYAPLEDLREYPSILLRGEVERRITSRGRQAVNYALLSTLATTLLIVLVLLRLLQRIVIAPLSELTDHAVEIGKTDDTGVRVGMQRDDEIGSLAAEFDRMLEKLARSREQLVRTARMAGMSQIATGVLHNVGNVLNSVNVAANMATKRAEQLPLQDLRKLVEILRENERDLAGFVSQDARGKHLLPFLSQLENALRDQREGIVRELRSLGGGIDHIAELVRAQQTYAGTRGVFERADLAEQIDAALRFCLQADGGHPDFAVEREFEALPKVSIDRHKLMEILVNLIQNARHAMRESRRTDRKLTLRLGAEGERVRIEVADNGCGIPPADLAKVFHHGFTTKKNGHGFGLHVSANAATELGGRLVAASEGQGRGATFLLDIPLLRPEPALAA